MGMGRVTAGVYNGLYRWVCVYTGRGEGGCIEQESGRFFRRGARLDAGCLRDCMMYDV